MPKCPSCDAQLDDETLVLEDVTTCPNCGASVSLDGDDLNLSSLAGGSPADMTMRVDPGSESSLGGSSLARSDDFSEDLSEHDPLGDATVDSGFAEEAFDSLDPEPESEATMAMGGAGGWGDDSDDDDDLEADFEVTEFDESEPEEPSEATSSSLDATMDLCDWMPKSGPSGSPLLELSDPGGSAGPDDATIELDGNGSADDSPGLGGGAGARDLTMMVGSDAGPEQPPSQPASPADDAFDATLPADSAHGRSGQDDSAEDFGSSGTGSSLSDSSFDRTESPSSMANDATMAFDSERRSSGVDTPEALNLTGLESGGTIPRGPLGDGRASASLKPGDSLVVGDESVRLRVSTVEEPNATAEGGVDFAIEKELGAGGMGVVYRARQQSLNRSVAIKQIKSQEATDSDRNKFVSEAVITGQLEHPNIVPVHDLGLAADGLPFYAMKAVGGDEWEKSIKENTEEENLSILIQVAQAIAFAHANQVLHRDLKPGNVMIGSFGEVLVMDWGLAARLDDGSEIQPAGTPIYMPPETALEYLDYAKGRVVGGNKKVESSRRRIPAGTYCDIYLLGALLFKIVTGRAPHRGKSTFECLRNAAKNEIVKTRRKSELLNIAYKAMATEPEERYPNATDFIDALKAYQSHAQSIQIAKSASSDLREAGRLIDSGAPEATKLYALFSSAQNGYQNALDLWDGNRKAKRRLDRTQRMFAETAFENGDFDLSLSMLDEASEKDADLRASVVAAQKSRNARLAWFKTLQYATAASLLAALSFIGYSIVLRQDAVSLRNEIAAKEEVVIQKEKQAKAATETARVKTQEAKAQTEIAAEKTREVDRLTILAENKTKEASIATEKAEAAQAKATRSEQVAVVKVQEAERATAIAEEKTAEADQQSYLAALSGLKATLGEDGVYAAWRRLQQIEPAVAAIGADRPEWAALTKAVQWQDEATELVAANQAAGSQPTFSTASSDGRWQAVVSPAPGGSRIALYPAGAAKPTHTGTAAVSPVAATIESTGRYVALAGPSLAVYDSQRGALIQLDGGGSPAPCLAFHPTKPELLVGRTDTSVERWTFAEGAATRIEDDDQWHQTAVTAVGYSPDGRQRFSADGTGRIIVWRDEDGTWSARTAVQHTGAGSPEITAGAISNDSKGRLAYGCVDGSVYEVAGWWDGESTASGYSDAADERLTGSHPGRVTSVAYTTASGSILSAGGPTMLVRKAPLASDSSPITSTIKRERRYHAAAVHSCIPIADGRVLSSDDRGRVLRWKLDVAPDTDTLNPENGRGAGVAAVRLENRIDASPRVVVADQDGFVRVWNDPRRPDARRKQFSGHADHRDFRAWRLDGPTPRIVTVAADNRACIWREQDGLLLRTLPLGDRTIVAVDTKNAVLYAATDGRPVKSGASAVAFRLGGDWPAEPLWSESPRVSALYPLANDDSSGALLAVGLRDGQVYLWGPQTGRVELTRSSARPHWRPITALHHDQRLGHLYSGDRAGLLVGWDLRGGTKPRELRLRSESGPISPIEKIFPSSGDRIVVARRESAGVRSVALSNRLDPGSLQELPAKGLRDVTRDPSGQLVGLQRVGQSSRFVVWSPDEDRWETIATTADRLTGLAASDAGWLSWGAGVVQWRPQRNGRHALATRVLSRPPISALIAPTAGVASLTRTGTINRWSDRNGRIQQQLLGIKGHLTASGIAEEGDQAVFALLGADGTTRIERWNLSTQRRSAILAERARGRCTALVTTDREIVAAFGDRLEVLPLAGGDRHTIALPAGTARPVSLAISGDSLAMATNVGSVFLGERVAGQWRLGRIEREDVSSVAFTPGGSRLLLGLASGRVVLAAPGPIDEGIVSARPLLTFEAHSDPVTVLQVAESADGARLISGDTAGRVVLRSL